MKGEIYDFGARIARYRLIIAVLRNGDIALRMLDHLASLGLVIRRYNNREKTTDFHTIRNLPPQSVPHELS